PLHAALPIYMRNCSFSARRAARGRCYHTGPRGRNTRMKIHEYQGKDLYRKFGVATTSCVPCFSVDEAVEAAKKLGGRVWVVKAQIHAGGRGKGGGVKVAKSLDEVREKAQQILGRQRVTPQTGQLVQHFGRLLIGAG